MHDDLLCLDARVDAGDTTPSLLSLVTRSTFLACAGAD